MSKFIDPELIKRLLHYDPLTGIFTWNNRPLEDFKSRQAFLTWNKRFANKRAGSVNNPSLNYQRRQIKVGVGYIKEHRLAWVYMTGEQPPSLIDHINRDATDNRWANIKASDYIGNSRNQSLCKRNTSGITGVVWRKDIKRWAARCMVNYQNKTIGHFDDKDDAERAVKIFRAQAGFNASHGSPKESQSREVVT